MAAFSTPSTPSTPSIPDNRATRGDNRLFIMTLAEFIRDHAPVRNTRQDPAHPLPAGPWGDLLHGLSKEEVELVENSPANCVWTLMRHGRSIGCIDPGHTMHKRVGHFVCSRPFANKMMQVAPDSAAFLARLKQIGMLNKADQLFRLSPSMQEALNAWGSEAAKGKEAAPKTAVMGLQMHKASSSERLIHCE